MKDERLTTTQFEEIMKSISDKQSNVWVKFVLPITMIHLFYPEFCFLSNNDKYIFSDENPDSVHIPFSINSADITEIYRDSLSYTVDGEWLFLHMGDGTEVLIEWNI